MKFKAISIAITVTFLLTSVSTGANAATLTGTTCPKVGNTKTVSSIKYFCVKSGKKLLWNKGTAVKVTATATPSASSSSTQSSTQSASTKILLDLKEVSKHDSGTSCWTIIAGNVFDLTKWISKHPGGAAVIRAICGKDGTDAFEGQHANQGKPAKELSSYFIGKVGESIKV